MTNDPGLSQAFRGVLVREAGTSADATAMAAAARRSCERLARQLTPLVGGAGIAAICTRSLHLVRQQDPRLAPAPALGRNDGPFTRVQALLERQDPVVAHEAGAAVLVTIAGLLAEFIGARLTTSLLREAWPDDFAAGSAEETIT